MNLILRGVPEADELHAMQALAAAFPEWSTHVVDLPYRLSSFVPHQQGLGARVETALWYEGGELVGWALWIPTETDMAVHPKHVAALEPEILAWSAERAGALARGRSEPLFWWVAVRDDNPNRIALLEAHGFSRREFVTLRYERALADSLPPPTLPDGYDVRPHVGADKIPAYVAAHRAAFGSTVMTEERRRRILQVL